MMSVAGRLGAALVVTLVVGASPAVAAAQSIACSPSSSLPSEDAADLSPSSIDPGSSILAVRETLPELAQPTKNRPRVLVPLYVSFAALQALDVHSTLRAVDAGGVEQNPFLKGLVNQPAALIALKGGIAASTILVADKLQRHNRIGAIVAMAALNSVYATVVAHNYRAVP
jgi:hypothetical protein